MANPEKTFEQSRWSIQDLFATEIDETAIQDAIDSLDQKANDFETLRSTLRDDIPEAEFLPIIHRLEEINLLASRLACFAELWFSEDTQNQPAQNLIAQINQLLAELSNKILFFSLWWKELDDENAQRLLECSKDNRYWLVQSRLFRKYTLSENEEKVINIKDVSGKSALNLLYDSITNRYMFSIEAEGKVTEITRGELSVYFRHTDPAVRQRAYQELMRVYSKDSSILGQIYQALARDWYNENVSLRGFTSPIATRNLANDIPDDVITTMLEVCRENAPIFHRYFDLKARLLGMKRLRRYDIYAPISSSDRTYTFSQAANLTLEAYRRFEPSSTKLLKRIFDERHIDSEVRKGKRGGAFCMSPSPTLTPWTLLNYQGKVGDVTTMAHEFGHALHTMLASHNTVFTFQPCLPLAETASTFGEMLLVESLLSKEKDPLTRCEILFHQIDDAYATVLRQAYFSLFERQAHDMIHQGASLDDLSAAYFENLKEQFGEAVDLADEFRWEWIAIPHFFQSPFYVYAYTFGQLLVLALYHEYLLEGDSFKQRYLGILSSGGSDSPMNILQKANFDVSSRTFWGRGFAFINHLITLAEDAARVLHA